MIPAREDLIFWTGVVEDRNDPLFLGRCRVRIHGFHSKFKEPVATSALDNPSADYIPIEELPWAYPIQPITSGAMTGIGHAPLGPVEGTWIFGFFFDGSDMQQPVMLGTLGGIELKDDEQKPGISTDTVDSTGETPQSRESNETKVDTPASVQASTGGVLGPLEQADVDALKKALGQRESSNNYGAVNQLGYVGKYQFGAAALKDLGYTNTAKNSELDTDANWKGKFGCRSKTDFLQNYDAQEAAMDGYLRQNYQALLSRGVITAESSKADVAGYLSAAHLVGAGGAASLKNGINKGDANGVKASSYYELGSASVGGAATAPPLPPSDPGLGGQGSNLPNVPSAPPTSPGSFDDALGFKDPNKVYPKFDDQDKRPDTNYLAYHDHIDKTHVKKKEDARVTDVETALEGESWDQPLSPYNSKYPFNHVFESESGHVLEFDDTAENERINLWHKKGTFLEIDKNGTMVTRIIGDGYWVLDRHGKISVGGDISLTVDGDANIFVKNDAKIQVDGDVEAKYYGDVKQEVSGKYNLSVREGFHVRAESFHVETDKESGEAMSFKNKAESAIRFESIGNIDIFAEENLRLWATKKLSLKATKPTGIIAMDTKRYYLQRRKADTADLVDKSLPGEEDMFEPDPKKNPSKPDFPTLETPYRKDKPAFFYDEPGYPKDEVDAYIQKQIDNGNYTQEDIDKTPPEVKLDETAPPDTKEELEKCPDGFEMTKDFSPALQLSNSFKLGQVSTGAAVTHDAVRDQHGLKKGEIVCNLRKLCIHTLDKIKAKYPNMIITSGFRAGGGGRSQHEKGQAADMQFPGMTKKEYYDIAVWIRDNCTYDQLILEYKTTGTGNPWIHVSLSNQQQKQVLTMMNHKVVAGSLNNLG